MFRNQIVNGACGCGCSDSNGCVQQKIMAAVVRESVDCASLDAAVSYINTNFGSISPLSLAWGSHPVGWQYAWRGMFDTPGDATPDSADTETFDELIGGGFEYQNISTATVDNLGNGVVIRTAFLLPDSTIYLVGSWYSADNSHIWQQSCVMSGVPTGCGYVFDIPIPPIDLCGSSESASSGAGGPDYNVFTTSTYDGMFADYLWSAFASMCAANPTTCGASTSPGACLTPDPFFGDEPP
ncbi:MAG TPA: hypothetical protein VGO67_25300 [Verrucomicrobiae bacterium]|jgi:hypothetical protein